MLLSFTLPVFDFVGVDAIFLWFANFNVLRFFLELRSKNSTRSNISGGRDSRRNENVTLLFKIENR